MKIGIVAPLFRDEVDTALDVANRAESLGLDGVFVFDHVWPMGAPDRPALNGPTVLAALGAETSRVTVGTLVARVSLLADAVLAHELETVHRMVGDRLVAGLGAGDRLSAPENRAYGIPFPSAAERVAQLVDCNARLRACGITTWLGGLSDAVWQAARQASALNVWGVDVERVAAARVTLPPEVEITWGGQVLLGRDESQAAERLDRLGGREGLVHGDIDAVAARFERLAGAGATWAVAALVGDGATEDQVGMLSEVAARLR